jgi:hypothetical protein
MTALVLIQPGQWVLAFNDPYGPWPRGDLDMAEMLERLQYGGGGWDCLRRPEEQFAVRQASRVMPKTYTHSRPSALYPSTMTEDRHHRENVVAAADSAGEMLALRDKLFAIGFAAERAIEEETARLIADFAAKTRSEALTKVHAALPHIFGRDL